VGYLKDLLDEAKGTNSEKRGMGEAPKPEKSQQQKNDEDIATSEPSALEDKSKTLIDSYGDVRIYRVAGEPLLWYVVPVPRPTHGERKIINLLKEATTRIVTLTTSQIRDPEAKKNVYRQKVLEIIESVPELGIPRSKREFYADVVVREMVGYGLLDPLVSDDQLEEIMVIGPKRPVYVFHRKYGMMKTNVEFYDDKEIQALIERIARDVNRHIDAMNPLLDARLPDGSRVNATIPPASVDGSTITIRKFRKDPYTVLDLISFGTMSDELAAFLWLAVDGMGAKPANILVSGGTGSGKTTTLNVLATYIPAHERIITIEDTAELNLPLEHWVRLEARPPSIEGTGEISMDVLVKNALRMRPDRIIVGEVRHKEAATLFTAMNTGHDGCMGTIHANSAEETLVRITSPPMNVPKIMASALDFVLVQNRIHDRRKGTIRRAVELAEVREVDGEPKTFTIFSWDAAHDKQLLVDEDIQYLKTLSEFTGLSVDELRDEWRRRKEYLARLRSSGVKGISAVKKAVQEYYEGAEKRWKKM
jgi:flagellar protein FlaI